MTSRLGLRTRFGRLGDGDMERVSCGISRSKDALPTWAYGRISLSNTSQHELDSCLRKLGVTCGSGPRHG
nr:pX=orf6 from 3' terminal nontranslated region [tomato bushy stunt tombusvirus TBSV, cherry strain, Peptide, 69 aa] [Tomato bushy stunt virus]